MGINKWIKKQITAAAVALSNVEKSSFSQQTKSFDSDNKHEKRYENETLALNLKNGEVTQEVKNLRWRMYKILKASEGLQLKAESMNSDGTFNFKAINSENQNNLLKKIKIDEFDTYDLEMVVNNSEITIDVLSLIDNKGINIYNEVLKEKNENGEEITVHGDISANDFFAINKSEKPIYVERDFAPKFFIENFTTKMNIRNINGSDKLLEFYVSKYPDPLRLTTTLFINQIKKAIETKIFNDSIFLIKEVSFISQNVLGTPDFLEYKYEISGIDKIIEFDGHYVIKYNAKVIINGKDILSEYVEEDLEKLYKNKEVKKLRI